ncbi:MAG: EAL domain-containing protein [Thiomicrorhabdus sp.]|nr:EAL domain-containing protein [Thiomicrorhabdus sp.]
MDDVEQQIARLEKTVERLKDEREHKREIFDAIHDGIIMFRNKLSIQTINKQAKTYLSIDKSFLAEETPLPLFKNKKCTISFKLDGWLKSIKQSPSTEATEILVWHCDPFTLKCTPFLFSAKALLNKKGKVKNILLAIYDRSIHSQADEQKRLMKAAFHSYNAQFISNEKGYIIKPNESFIAMSGLSADSLKKMTLMQWIEKQVTLTNDTNGLLKSLIEQRFWSGEVEIHPSCDATFYAILSISMILDAESNIEHYIVSLQNITDIKEAHNKIEHMAFYDGLTGLANRKLAIEYINTAIKNHRRHHTYGALLYINIDRFKGINDAFGRKTGDRFLKKIAFVLKKVLRDEDQIARIGGDEFVISTQDRELNSENAVRNATKLAYKVLNALNHHFLVDELTLHSSARIGMIIYPAKEDSAESLLINADLAAGKAKYVKKKHKIFIYEPSLTEEVKTKRQLENDLTLAHKKGEICLYYQAQIDSKGQLHGAETLVRWNHPKLGFIAPYQFIKIAEESRQILKLGAWIMHQAFIQTKRWSKQRPDFNLSINISPIQFHEADFIDNVISILIQTQVNPKNITLELTEGVLISDTESAVEKIDRLVEVGFKVSIDDFGTGYSSLSYFQRLPINELKIDKSFIARVPKSKEDVAIVESIVRLAQSKNLLIVAEGVETQEQIDFLNTLPDEILIQGYFYSMPCPTDEFERNFIASQ